jgi:hypothetical protein
LVSNFNLKKKLICLNVLVLTFEVSSLIFQVLGSNFQALGLILGWMWGELKT